MTNGKIHMPEAGSDYKRPAMELTELELWDKASISVARHIPGNLFSWDEPVSFLVNLTAPAAAGTLSAVVTDYDGCEILKKTVPVSLSGGAGISEQVLGVLPMGYYELVITAAFGNRTVTANKVTFGVVEFTDRTAREAVESGNRFGLKMYYHGAPTWGDYREAWNGQEIVAATTRLGLQWTRALFNQSGSFPTLELIRDYPMNVVMKVERFPEYLFDAERYGPLDEWEKHYGKGQWTLKTVPKKEPYKAWLREELRKLPPEQNVFEIWNEPWDKMSPEDFAGLSQTIVSVIREIRPDAVIGPNLFGSTSRFQYDAKYIKAGGMAGMNMVALHPYAVSEDRAWLRDYHQWMNRQTGREIDLYVTEFGSHSTPEGPSARTEREQVGRTVRQALALYAEDVKVFTPHWMGQAERDPTYIEDWFGFFRVNHQPKPVLIAYAVAAKMIDGSRYAGDLWYGPGCDAMLFERDGIYTLALFTKGGIKDMEVTPGTDSVTMVNTMGVAVPLRTTGGKLRLTLGGDTIYLVGVSPALEEQASAELIPERWPERDKQGRRTRIAHKLRTVPVMDGKPDKWEGMTRLALLNSKVNASDDCMGTGYVGYDDRYLYIAVNVRDNEVLNIQPPGKVYLQDSLELFLSMAAREDDAGYGPDDHQFFIAPASSLGRPVVVEVTDRAAATVSELENAPYYVGKTDMGWAAEVAIPWVTLNAAPKPGAVFAMEMRLNDADSTHERWKLDEFDGTVKPDDPTSWSYLQLEE